MQTTLLWTPRYDPPKINGATVVDFSIKTRGTDGNFFTVGWEHWSLYDDTQFAYEFGAYGFLTGNDNAYDGYEATTQVGKDSKGRWVGGENFNHGNLLVPLSQYLHNVGRNQAEWIEVFGREVLPKLTR